MERNEIKQNELVLSEEEERIHKPRLNRRLWLNCDTDSWPSSVKENAICPLSITVEKDLQLELLEIAKTLEYKDVHSVLNICFWPDCAATDLLKEKFSIFAEDIDKYLVLRNRPLESVYPHKDPVRGTSIYLPLGPLGSEYKPLEIYYDNDEYGVPENDTPIVYAWNTKATHAVFNNNNYRYNMQASLNLPYAEVFEKYRNVFKV
jgi:hypothetical protein